MRELYQFLSKRAKNLKLNETISNLIKRFEKENEPLLHLTCSNNFVSLKIIENKSDVNSMSEYLYTSLHLECKIKNISVEIIKYLENNLI